MRLLFAVCLLASLLQTVHSSDPHITYEGERRFGENFRVCCTSPIAHVKLGIGPQPGRGVQSLETIYYLRKSCWEIKYLPAYENAYLYCTRSLFPPKHASSITRPLSIYQLDEPVITGPARVVSGNGSHRWSCKAKCIFAIQDEKEFTVHWEPVENIQDSFSFYNISINRGHQEYAPLDVVELESVMTVWDVADLARSTTFRCNAVHWPSKTTYSSNITVTRRIGRPASC